MKIREGNRPGTAHLVPSDTGAELVVTGLEPEELAAAFGQGRWPRTWARERNIRVELPGPESSAAEPAAPAAPSLERAFEDGTVSLFTGRPAQVRVAPTDEEPEFPMPKCLMVAIAHQWARLGRMTLHAAAIEYQGTGLLALGRSGAGKTTLSLAAIAAGGRIVSDDWVMLREENGALLCTSLRDRLLVRTSDASQTLLHQVGGRLKAGKKTPDKRWFDGRAGELMRGKMHCGAIVALRQEDPRPDQSNFERLKPASLYSEILNATSALLMSNRLATEAAALQRLARQLNRLPSVSMTGGKDVTEVPIGTCDRLAQALSASQ